MRPVAVMAAGLDAALAAVAFGGRAAADRGGAGNEWARWFSPAGPRGRWRGGAGRRRVAAGFFPHLRGWGWGGGLWACKGRWGRGGAAGLSFAGLLRQLRAEAKLTQEELAEAATPVPAVGQ